jgi:hypothetical protein
MIAFYVLSRFRVPIVVVMMPLAGYGLQRITQAAVQREIRWAVGGAVAVLGLSMFMLRPIPDIPPPSSPESPGYARPVIESSWYEFSLRRHYQPRMERAVTEGDRVLARREIESFLAVAPAFIAGLDAKRRPPFLDERQTAYQFAIGFRLAERVCRDAGDLEAADRYGRRADDIDASIKLYDDEKDR